MAQSSRRSFRSGGPYRFILEPLLFDTVRNDWDTDTQCTLTNLQTAQNCEERLIRQKVLDSLEKLGHRYLMNFNKMQSLNPGKKQYQGQVHAGL